MKQHRLFKRKNGYYYQRVCVPADIRDIYGKAVEQISLGTTDFRAARKLLPASIVKIDQKFEEFRSAAQPRNRQAPKARVNTPLVYHEPLMSVVASECFQELKRQKGWSPKTENTRQSQIRLFLEICGDKPLSLYTQADIRAFKQSLFSLPANAHSYKAYRGLTKLKIAALAKDDNRPRLSNESVRQIMTTASLVFGWARGNYQATLTNLINPMMPRMPTAKEKRNSRSGFTVDELNKLFALPVFHGVKSVANWSSAGSVSLKEHGLFWIPLLSLFAGLRLMEAVQLTASDVKSEDGIWFLDINSNNAKRLKNYSSERQIPIHKNLINAGFLDFVRCKSKEDRLFSEIEIGPPEQRQRHASKLFNKMLSVAGIKGEKKVWHSMKHTFEQFCRDSEIDAAIIDQLQGHAQRGMRAVYGRGYGITSLHQSISKLQFRSLDLGFL
ncbi:site-specific integrase [Rhizobium flavescens]|uniref:site-specific integrase n=1 Tax=Rhizobium flavescens TaxID=2607407 RepID=UPI00140ADC11|nr:site-specific integrase [Rhizobium flavescens]